MTPFQIVTSEIRRQDRRGTTPEHILYMAAKIMRLIVRVASGLHATYRCSGDLSKVTRQMIEDKGFLKYCVEHNFAFLKSIEFSAILDVQEKRPFCYDKATGKTHFFFNDECK